MAEQSMLRNILEEMADGKKDNQGLLLDLSQNVITHAAAISRYFWPSSNKEIHKLRGSRLREAFDIDDSNSIKSREVRNFAEHFDEKLDIFLSNSVSGSIYPSYVGNSAKNEETSHYLRAYFINDWKFHALGSEIRLYPIINKLIRIHQLLEEFNANGGRLPIKRDS